MSKSQPFFEQALFEDPELNGFRPGEANRKSRKDEARHRR